MGKPHLYAEVIKAWADGAEVQYYDCDKWWDWKNELTVGLAPTFDTEFKWRVKPQTKRFRVFLNYKGNPQIIKDIETPIPEKCIRWLTDWVEYEVN